MKSQRLPMTGNDKNTKCWAGGSILLGWAYFTSSLLTKCLSWPGLTKPVRPGYGLGRYQTGPNSKFKFEFKKIKNPKLIIPTGKLVKPVYRPQFKIQI